MSIDCSKCLYSCTPQCCMDQYSKETVHTKIYEDTTVPAEVTQGQQIQSIDDTLMVQGRYFSIQQIDQLNATFAQQMPNVLDVPQNGPDYRKNGSVASDQSEYARARTLFSRINGVQQGTVLDFTMNGSTVRREDAVYQQIRMNESVEIPCVFGCFTMLKKLFCGT